MTSNSSNDEQMLATGDDSATSTSTTCSSSRVAAAAAVSDEQRVRSMLSSSDAEHLQNMPSMPPQSSLELLSGIASITGNNNIHQQQRLQHQKLADKALAQTLNQLSIDERQRILDDVHGCASSSTSSAAAHASSSSSTFETPEFINQCLLQMDMHLPKVPPNFATTLHIAAASQAQAQQASQSPQGAPFAFLLSMHQDPSYTMGLRLMFLRSVSYHPKNAAYKMIQYFQFKLELFGTELLSRDITQQDLMIESSSSDDNDDNSGSGTDFDALQSGKLYQVLPGTDSSGRTIMFSHMEHSHNMPINGSLRAVWYMVMSMLQTNIRTQIDGIVSVVYDCFPRIAFTMKEQILAWKSCKLLNVLPFRIASLHYCFNDPILHALVSMCTLGLGPTTRTRLRTHFGSHHEIMYELMTFGILPKMLPIEVKGINQDVILLPANHKTYLERLRVIENAKRNAVDVEQNQHDSTMQSQLPEKKRQPTVNDSRPDNIVLRYQQYCDQHSLLPHMRLEAHQQLGGQAEVGDKIAEPSSVDVLLGKGRRPSKHVGNMRFHKLLEEYEEKYDKAGRYDKAVVTEMVVTTIRQSGGRFLRQDGFDTHWTVISDSVARSRVAHGFRNLRIKKKTKIAKENSVGNNKGSSILSAMAKSSDKYSGFDGEGNGNFKSSGLFTKCSK